MPDKIKCIFCGKSVRKYKKWKTWVGRNDHYSCYKEDRDYAKKILKKEKEDRDYGYLKRYRYWKDRPENKIEQV